MNWSAVASDLTINAELHRILSTSDPDPRAKIEAALTAQKTVIDNLHTGSRDVRRGKTIAAFDAAKRLDWVTYLNDLYKKTMDGWISAKSIVDRTGLRKDVYNVLLDLSEATVNFNDAATQKMSDYIIKAGSEGVKSIQVAHVERAIKTFK
jgi:hypothetical protein